MVDAGPDQALCLGGSVRIGLEPKAGLAYKWSPADGLSSATEARPLASPGETTTYTLTVVETATGRSAMGSVVVTVHGLPVTNAGEDAAVGPGGSVTLGVPGAEALTYSWSPAAGLSAADVSQPIATPDATTTYTLTVTDANGCTGVDSVEVFVGAPLVANAGEERTTCSGQPTSIGQPARGGISPYTYEWSASPACTGCLSSTSGATVTATPSATTTFTQTVRDASGATTSSSVLVSVSPGPGTAGANRYLDKGASITLGPAPVAGASYTWSCNRADCALSRTDVAQPVAGPVLSTTYTLEALSAEGCTTRSSMTVWVNLQADTVPRDGETIPLSSWLLVQFDQPIKRTTLTTSTVLLNDANTGDAVSVSLDYDEAHRRLWVRPTGGNYKVYAENAYTLTLVGGPAGIASDDAVLPNRFAADVMVDFSIAAADTTPPGISFRSPASGATEVAPNSTVVVTFNEAVNPDTVTASNFTLSGAGAVAGSVRYEASTRTATFTPAALLAFATTYTVTLNGVADLSGNALSTGWSFITGSAPDTTRPTVTAVSPQDESTGVESSTVIRVTFSEAVDTTTLSAIQLRDIDAGTQVAGTLIYDSITRVATFTPTVLLGSMRTYEVRVSGVKDLAGNAMELPFTSLFTTRQTLFADDFEEGTDAWLLPTPATGTPWSLTTSSFRSATHSLTDSANGKYANSTQSFAEMAQPLNVSGLSSVSIQFWMRVRTERNSRDFVAVEASLDGGAWFQLPGARYSGNANWAVYSLPLDVAGKASLRVRFRFESNANKNFDGVYIDDLMIQGQ